MHATPDNAGRVLRPILDAVDRHPREIHSIVQGLTVLEDRNPNTDQYWYLWGLFAAEVKGARWVAWLDREHPTGSEMLSAIFMTSWWKDNVRHWRSLEGYAHHVHALFEAMPRTSIVLDDYLRFVYHIGERSLPEAFIRVAAAIQNGNASACPEHFPSESVRESAPIAHRAASTRMQFYGTTCRYEMILR